MKITIADSNFFFHYTERVKLRAAAQVLCVFSIKGRQGGGETLRFSTELCWRRCEFTPFYFLCCFASFALITVACVSLWLLWPSRSFQQRKVPAGFVVSSVAQGRIWEPASCSPSSHPGAHVISQGQQHNQQQQQEYCSVNACRCRPFMAFVAELMQYHRVPERSGGTGVLAPPTPPLPVFPFFVFSCEMRGLSRRAFGGVVSASNWICWCSWCFSTEDNTLVLFKFVVLHRICNIGCFNLCKSSATPVGPKLLSHRSAQKCFPATWLEVFLRVLGDSGLGF